MGIEEQLTCGLYVEVRASETAGYAGSRIDRDHATAHLTVLNPTPIDKHSTH